MTAALCVCGVACWPPSASERGTPPPARLLPPRMRGRASKLTAAIVEAGEQAARAAGLDPATLPWLIGSAYGELETTVQLLHMMASGDGALSPARFQASVHNTAAGMLSIATGNRGFSTSLAAGPATTGALLLEAYGMASRFRGPALIVVADEPLPVPFVAEQPSPDASAVALVLAKDCAGPTLARMTIVAATHPCADVPETDPQAFEPALTLVRAVRAAQPTRVSLPAAHGRALLVDVTPERAPA